MLFVSLQIMNDEPIIHLSTLEGCLYKVSRFMTCAAVHVNMRLARAARTDKARARSSEDQPRKSCSRLSLLIGIVFLYLGALRSWKIMLLGVEYPMISDSFLREPAFCTPLLINPLILLSIATDSFRLDLPFFLLRDISLPETSVILNL